jgi:hypothetical protein
MEHRFLHVFEMLEGWPWPACRWVVRRHGHRPWSSIGRRWSSMGRRWSSMGRLWSLIGRRWVVDGRRWVVDGHQQLLESGVTVGPSQPTPRNETPPYIYIYELLNKPPCITVCLAGTSLH